MAVVDARVGTEAVEGQLELGSPAQQKGADAKREGVGGKGLQDQI